MTSFLQYCVNTLGYLRLMTVSDLIDIAILSFLFYKCIGIFQRTNAAKVAKALLLIIVAMWISYQFNLNAISFILNKAVELGLLAVEGAPAVGARGEVASAVEAVRLEVSTVRLSHAVGGAGDASSAERALCERL